MSRDILVVVGPRSFADVRAYSVMREVMTDYVAAGEPDEIWSGGADGGDIFAESLALEWGIPFRAILPNVHRWGGTGGFRDRDRHMAERCARLLGFSCRWPSSGGAIWTANHAESLGKPVTRHVIPQRAVNGKIETWGADGRLARLLVQQTKVVQRADGAPPYTESWVGQDVDTLLARLRKSKARVRWTGFA